MPERRDAPRLSVVMAAYNGERYIADAIRSVLEQSFRDFEFLIVDDGSTDGTSRLVRGFGDPRIRLIRNAANCGLTRSLNVGLSEARGEFIARLDADDLCEPGRFASQIQYLDSHPEVGLLGSWYREVDARGRTRREVRLPCTDAEIRWSLYFHSPFAHSAAMWRREPVLERVGYYNATLAYSMDYEYWLRIAREMALANVPEYLIRYRVHDGSMTATRGDVLEGERLRVARVAQLLGWSEDAPRSNTHRLRTMAALAFGGSTDAAPHVVLESAEQLLRLHELYCDEAGISAAERHRLVDRLRARVSRRLLLLASSSRDRVAADRLLNRAFELGGRSLLHAPTLTRSVVRFLRTLTERGRQRAEQVRSESRREVDETPEFTPPRAD
jgi:hypothetical protein